MKELYFGGAILIILLFVIAGIDFRLYPFKLRFANPYLGIGFALIIMGVFFIYYQGHLNAHQP